MNYALLAAAAIATSPVVDAELRGILREYDSAQIEAISLPRTTEWKDRCGLLWLAFGCKNQQFIGTMHCYRINGKNAYGGYTGWVYYWFLERDGSIYDYGDQSYLVRQYCGLNSDTWQSDPALKAVISR